jgi:hypothetical protein
MAGDFNEDGTVDAADYVVWRKNGTGQDDYGKWRANFGRTAGGGAVVDSSVGAVPEPMAGVILLTAALAVLCCPRTLAN